MNVTIDDRVRAVIVAELGIAANEGLGSDQALKADLGADSMDSYNLVLALEEEFGIEIPDRALGELQTVRQIVQYVTAHVAAAS